MSPNDAYIELAVKTAMRSPCRSKRGVVIWDEDGIVTFAFNRPPIPFICDGSAACKATCSRTAVHAEQSALLSLIPARPSHNPEMLHVKAVDDKLVVSGPPSCLECAKLILHTGIKAMWLFHESGWRRYPADEFYARSGKETDYITFGGRS